MMGSYQTDLKSMEETTDKTISQIDDHLLIAFLKLQFLFKHKWFSLWISCLSNNHFCPQVPHCPHLDNVPKDAEVCRTPGKPNFFSLFLHQWGKAQQLWILLQCLA